MINRRTDREAAIQFLYAIEVAKQSPEELSADFWEIREERERQKILFSQSKQAINLIDSFHSRYQTFVKHLDSMENATLAVDASGRLGGQYTAMLKALETLLESLFQLKTDLKHSKEASGALVSASLSVCDTSLQKLVRQHEQFNEIVKDADEAQVNKIIDPLNGNLSKLDQLEQRLQAVIHPLENSEVEEAKVLGDKLAELRNLREIPDGWVKKIHENMESIDEKIEEASERFKIAEIQHIDRSIIRLATFEMTETDTPKAVIIDEALEVAKRFSTRESVSFINGVLDGVSKTT